MTVTEVDELRQKVASLRHELLEAEETIRAIHDGRVDAFVVGGNERDRVYTLESIEGPFRILVERMQQGAVTVSADGTILYVNHQSAALLGRRRERLVGCTFRTFVTEADRSLFDALIAGEIDRPRGELRLEHADRTLIPVYVSAAALSPGNGGDVCLLITDLTQQKAHEELIAAETMARSMLEQAADAVVVCDPEGSIVLASPAAHELCGRNPLRQPFAEMFPLTLDARPPCAPDGRFVLSRLHSRIRGVEVSLHCAEEKPMRLLLSASPVTDVYGEPLGSVVTITDIGALQRAEDELKPVEADGVQRVLVVDDNRDSANSLGMLLDVMDYEVKVAFDGASALEELDNFHAEAIFLDIDMPGMDGYEVARRIRARSDLEDVVLVAVTGWGQDNDRALSRDAGFDHHLLKPVEVESLRAVLAAPE